LIVLKVKIWYLIHSKVAKELGSMNYHKCMACTKG
jgi:hypothetical protein